MRVDIALLGRFAVLRDGEPVPDDAWSRRGAASLVKLLALTDGRRMHRERVMDALWPELTVDAAGPRLHKAAHYARRALGDTKGAVLLRQDQVLLLADHEVTVDALVFRSLAAAAVASGSATAADEALAAYGGQLLPDDPYEPRAAPTGMPWPPSATTSCAWPAGGRSCSRTSPRTRTRTSPSPGSTPTAATSAPRSDSWSGWTSPCVASSEPSRATTLVACANSWPERTRSPRPPRGRSRRGSWAAETSTSGSADSWTGRMPGTAPRWC
jgi:hypothetical protein